MTSRPDPTSSSSSPGKRYRPLCVSVGTSETDNKRPVPFFDSGHAENDSIRAGGHSTALG